MAYLGKTPSQAVRSRYYFTATGGETSLSGTDDNSNTLTFTDGNYVDVALNGVTLVAGTDYNTTTTNTIGGLTALVASDVVEVIVYDTFSVFSGNVNGDFTVGGTLTAASYSGLPTTTLTSLGIPNHDDITVDGSGNVGIGAPPNATFGSLLYTQGTPAANKPIVSAYSQGNSNNAGFALFNDSGNRGIWTTGSTMRFTRTYEGNSTADVTIDASGNVGIGTALPAQPLHVVGGAVQFQNTQSTYLQINTGDTHLYTAGSHPLRFGTNSIERLRIESGGNLLVGTTGALITGNAKLSVNGQIEAVTSNTPVIDIARSDGSGSIINLRKGGGAVVGSIGVGNSSSYTYIGTGDTGLMFNSGNDFLQPWNPSTNSIRDATIDIGRSSSRFKDLYLSGGVQIGNGNNISWGGSYGSGYPTMYATSSSGGYIAFAPNGNAPAANQVRIVNDGIEFGAASSNLNDYEEGTWNVTIVNGGLTPSVTSASYTKIGNRVFLSCHLIVPTNTVGQYMALGGLPFSTNGDSAGSLGYTTATTSDSIGLLVQGSTIYVYKDAQAYATSEFSNYEFRISAQYRTF